MKATPTHLQQLQKAYQIGIWVVVCAGIILYAVIGVCAWRSFQPKVGFATCNDFPTYTNILYSYSHGNRGLDGDGDGIPCENRK